MERRKFVTSVIAGSLAAPVLAAGGQHDHGDQVDGPLAQATVSFGQWHTSPSLDRFPNNSPINGNVHKVIEERLRGREVSMMAFCDGERFALLATSEDHKAVGDGDVGPNTGGMGAYTPLTWVPDDLVDEVLRTVLQPTVDEMARRGTPFSGLLYAGLALTYEWAAFYTAWSGGDLTARETAERLALKAVSLDPTDHQPHVALAWVYQERRDFDRSRRHLERAEALNPNDADIIAEHADALVYVGQPERSVELLEKAMRLNPYYPDWYLWYLADAYTTMKRHQDVVATVQRMQNPDEGRRMLASSYAHLGMM